MYEAGASSCTRHAEAMTHLQRTHLHEILLLYCWAARPHVEQSHAYAQVASASVSSAAAAPERMPHPRRMHARQLCHELAGAPAMQLSGLHR